MRTQTNIVLLGCAFASVSIGIIFRCLPVAIISVPIFSYLAIGSIYSIEKNINVKISRTLSSDKIFVGDSLGITLSITNLGKDIKHIELFDTIPKDAEIIKGSNNWVLHLRKGETVNLEYEIKLFRSGRCVIGDTKWRTRDMTDLFLNQGRLKNYDRIKVLVSREDTRKLKLQLPRTRRLFGYTPAKGKGLGNEFFSLREYVPSDERRKINWKASARFDKLLTNEYEIERSGDVMILIDNRDEHVVGIPGHNTIDACVKGAVAVAQKVVNERNRVGFLIIKDRLYMTPMSTSRRHILKISDELFDITFKSSYPFHWLPWIIKNTVELSTYVVVFSPLLDDKLSDALTELAVKGYDVIVISPYPTSYMHSIYSKNYEMRIANMVTMLKRQNRILKLRKFTKVIDWDIHKSLSTVLIKRYLWYQRR